MSRIILCTHNLTEGDPTRADLESDLFHGCEVGRGVGRPFRQAGFRVYRPLRDRKQILAWDPREIKKIKTSYRRFHRSGTAERWDISTPPRGLLSFQGIVRDEDKKIAAGGTWVLNSWGKPEERERLDIVERTTLPVIRKWIEDMEEWGADYIYLMGDMNNVRWGGRNLAPLVQVAGGGELDRILAHPDNIVRTWHGPKTGVGPDLKHRSLHAEAVV